MSTENQLLANRQNAQQSTGPRTPEGKARSSRNALKHGFFAREVLLPQEDAEEYDAFARAMREDLRPVGPMEEVLAGQLIVSAWRLKRFACIESGVFSELLSRARQACTDEEGAMGSAPTEEMLWGRAFIAGHEDDQVLTRLTRYQSLLTRDFYRAFHDLQRLQASHLPFESSSSSSSFSYSDQNEATETQLPPPPVPGGRRGVGPVENTVTEIQHEALAQNEPISSILPIPTAQPARQSKRTQSRGGNRSRRKRSHSR